MSTDTIKSGDRVWIGNSYGERDGGLRLVAKVTPTQIVIDWNGNGLYLKRFKRDGGYEIGGGWRACRVGKVASSKECKAFDAEAKAKADSQAAKKKADEEREVLRGELRDLFGEDAWVADEGWNNRVGFTLELHHLSEQRIREIAKALRVTS